MNADNFLIIRLSSLGDIIHTLPAFSALRKKYPDAKISWAVEKNGKEILDFVPGIDEIIIVDPAKQGGSLRKTWKFISQLKAEIKNRDQVSLDFQGLIKSGFISFLSRSRRRIGFRGKNLKEPLASLFYNDRLEEFTEDNHVINKNLRLLTKLGIEEDLYDFPLKLPRELLDSVKNKMTEIGHTGTKSLVILNVGAGWETKQWFPEKWVEFWRLIKQEDIFPLLLWGNEREKDLALTVELQTKIPIAPSFSIKEVMALLKQASILVSGDTFALHATCAFGIPVVGIYGPSDPQRNGPFSTKDRVAVHEMECSFCFKRTCPTLECIKSISAEEVAELFFQVLKEND